MRLLHREPETPSLETWLSRDVPHEREMASELLEKMGREKSLAALLVIHNREETKREKSRRLVLRAMWVFLGAAVIPWLFVTPVLSLLTFNTAFAIQMCVLGLFHTFNLTTIFTGYGQYYRASQRQQNIVTALFAFDDNPLIAEALCRALPYYSNDKAPWALFTHLSSALALLPDDKEMLTKEAHLRLRNRLPVLETRQSEDLTSEAQYNRAQQADFEIAVLRYFARTQDKQALRAIRKLAQAKTYSNDGARVRDAARATLQAFGESVA